MNTEISFFACIYKMHKKSASPIRDTERDTYLQPNIKFLFAS